MVDTDTMYGGAFQAMPSNIDKIKLNKNTNAKGDIHYEWEIQTMGLDIEKIRKLNNELLAIYG